MGGVTGASQHHYRTCRDELCERFPCRVYAEGYRYGHDDGEAEGHAKGHAEGYDKGHAARYSAGYAAGAASCN
jgi:hypothetical protein